MFGFFRKKSGERPEEEERLRESRQESREEVPQELHALGQKFLPEEWSILAVTGANGFEGAQDQKDGPQVVSIGLTAWKEEDGEEPARRENTRLVALADSKLLSYLRRRAMPDSVIQVTVRPSEDFSSFLMVELPQPETDPEMKAILEEQKKPVSFWEGGLGTFTLNRSMGWFEAEADWLGQSIRLDFDRDENQADCLMQFHTLMENQRQWDERVRAFAAEQLLSLAKQWEEDAADNEEREAEEITREQFMERMELDAVQMSQTGDFEFWFNDGDLFWGHAIRVTGSLEKGPEEAQMEG